MPELPEVQLMRQYFEETSLHQKIERVDVHDKKVLSVDENVLKKAVEGSSFTTTNRIGKYLFPQLESGDHLMIHFGMTGSLAYQHGSLDLPRFGRVVFKFENGYELAYVCPRKFGRIDFTKSIDDYRKAKKLGPDLLEISKKDFVAALRGRQAPIKPTLLEQRHFAGIGNWIADEILWRTKIHPETRVHELSDRQLGALHKSGTEVVLRSIDHDTQYGNFPDDFFAKYRVKDGQCLRHEVSLEKSVVGGRGTFTCPKCQKPVSA